MTARGGEADPDARAAEARGRAYALLAELIANGVTERVRGAAEASPLLAEALDGASDETLAADHHHAFDYAVAPYEGAFLEPDRRIAGPSADRVVETYREVGYRPDPRGPEPEHFATELRALAFLCGAEMDAAEDGAIEAWRRSREAARRVLDRHPLRWVFALRATVDDLARPLPSALLQHAEELLCLHRHELGGAPHRFALPDPDLDLDAPETDLKAIAEYLAAPARSGLYLSVSDLATLGRAHRVPRGFGDRARSIALLLGGAARYEAWAAVLGDLRSLLARRAERLREAPTRAAWAEPLTAPWTERLAHTDGVLQTLGDADRARPV